MRTFYMKGCKYWCFYYSDIKRLFNDEYDVDDFQDHVDDAVGQDIRDGVDVVDDPHEDLAGRAAVVVAERQLLQVGEEVLPDIEDDALRNLDHDPLSDRDEDDAHNESNDQQYHERDKVFNISVRDRMIESLLCDHG